MKRKKFELAIILSTLIIVLFGCGNSNSSVEESGGENDKVIIGTSAIANDVLEVAIEEYHKMQDDYVVENQVFDDAIAPNTALAEGSINATFHQYIPYMENYNQEYNTDLQTYGPEIFAFQIGLYSNEIDSLDDIEEGMTVAISNDPSNRALGLQLLDEQGVIELDPEAEMPSVLDIVENPYNLQFVEMERLNLANAIEDTDMAIVMTDVVKEAGYDPSEAIAFAQEPGIYLVIDEEEPWMEGFVEALTNDTVRTYIEEETDSTKKALF